MMSKEKVAEIMTCCKVNGASCKIINCFAVINGNQPMSQQRLGTLHRLSIFLAEAVGDTYLE